MAKARGMAMYGLSRIDDSEHRTHAWRVSLSRRGKVFVKNFPDKKHGGKEVALHLAKQYRDELLLKFPPLRRVEFANAPRRNNKSGVAGVCLVTSKYYLTNGAERSIRYWEAIWPINPGGRVLQRFSIATYGMEKAFEMACKARRNGLRKVTGIFWAAERGLV